MARAEKKDAKIKNKKDQEQQEKGRLRDYFESLIVAIILALIVKTFVVQTFQIPTGSMEDGLLVGDHIIVNKMIYGPTVPVLDTLFPVRDIKRGDIVIFKYPPDPRTDYIKRVIGLPGETVEIYQHQVYIDGTPIEELGLEEDRYTLQWRNADVERAEAIDANTGYEPSLDPEAGKRLVFKVPEEHYFMMGDHRAVSRDSRYWGTVPRKNITGRAVVTYWSYNANREEYRETNPVNQAVNLVKSFVTFPVNTRWGRILNIIR